MHSGSTYCRYYGNGIYASNSNISISIIHNIISNNNNCGYALNVKNSNIYSANNIVASGIISRSSDNFWYNMSNSGQLFSGNGNLRNIDMNKVFVKPGIDFHLLENSPAKGAGEDGVDMGIYGGKTPFIDGFGKPAIPSIIKLKADHAVSKSEGLKIEIKARSNSE